MTTTAAAPAQPYQGLDGCYDEMLAADGTVRDHWSGVEQVLAELGPKELNHRRREVHRLLREDSVTHSTYGTLQGGDEARWRLDPVPVVLSSIEWASLEAGIIQRAELLNLVLEDIYGDRDLLRRGLIPPELIYAHPGFLRPCDGLRVPGAHQLFSYAADLVRGASGGHAVLSDRSQTPSGFGYALENRTVISRVFPSLYRSCEVHRLAPFFRSLRMALQAASPPFIDDPRIVVLTPGPRSHSAFEHAFLASQLGYSLVEGSDLCVRGGRVWLRSLGRLQPVHVILRRLDAGFCDPLELMADSQLGVAGLVEACRVGNVTVVNALGSSVIENPGLLPYLPGVARHLLGGELQLPAVETWWCGDPVGRSHVLARLDELVIKPIGREDGAEAAFGWTLDGDEREALRRRIEANPVGWVGQAAAAMSSTPTLGDAGLEPRRTVLRAFAVARNQSYTVMPGGLATVASGVEASRDRPEVSVSKDIWVLASEPERMTGFWLQTGPAVKPGDPGSSIPSRVAENLFWLGRYAERAEGVARLLRVVYDRRNDFPGNANPAGTSCLSVLLVALTTVTTTWPGFADGVGADQRERPGAELYQLVVDAARPGTLAHAIHHLLDAAYGVRDQLSNDTWLAVGALDREIFDLRGPLHEPQADVQGVLQRVVQSLLALSGLINESMVRDPGWQFMDAGRRFERALQLLRLLQATLTETRGTASDSLLFESVLTAAESIITYRRRYRSQAQLETVLDLLLLDADNPRSVAFQLERLNDNLATLPNATSERLGDEQRFVLEASTAVRIADNASLAAAGADGRLDALDGFLGTVVNLLAQGAEALERRHFDHLRPQWAMVAPSDSHGFGQSTIDPV
ncbi:MAG TPA: circularly permuted type 2 ATP-grasp protein [Acidimicrobiales bacterium]|jgi:uncharacterized circularly permuted ATP-grasp superfamily protein/uncharacterized alpha-E superfamily protein